MAKITVGTLVRVSDACTFVVDEFHGMLGVVTSINHSRNYPYSTKLIASGEHINFALHELEVPDA
jgi:hypothetical protein